MVESSHSKNRFEIDYEGWRASNTRRPQYELVREIVSNALDADGVTKVTVEVMGPYVCVEDDAPGGVKDLDKLLTLFTSTSSKDDSKRGRKGRGVKEFISATHICTVETVGCKIEFGEGRTVTPSSDRASGTKIYGYMDMVDADIIGSATGTVTTLRSLIVPPGVILTVNGEVVPSRTPRVTLNGNVTCDDSTRHDIQIELHALDATGTERNDGYIYELGIPITHIYGLPVDINCLGKIALGDMRNSISKAVLSDILGAVAAAAPEQLITSPDQVDRMSTDIVSAIVDGARVCGRFDNLKSHILSLYNLDPGKEPVHCGSLSDDDSRLLDKNGYTPIKMPYRLGWALGLRDAMDVAASVMNRIEPIDVDPKVADPGGLFTRFAKYAVRCLTGSDINISFATPSNEWDPFSHMTVACDINRTYKCKVPPCGSFREINSIESITAVATMISIESGDKLDKAAITLAKFLFNNGEYFKSMK